jgi:UDP-glucuronate 4-epimerase
VDRISAALGLQASIAWQPEQPGDMKHSLADIEQAREQLGFWPKVSIADGIPRFIAWWRSAHSRAG